MKTLGRFLGSFGGRLALFFLIGLLPLLALGLYNSIKSFQRAEAAAERGVQAVLADLGERQADLLRTARTKLFILSLNQAVASGSGPECSFVLDVLDANSDFFAVLLRIDAEGYPDCMMRPRGFVLPPESLALSAQAVARGGFAHGTVVEGPDGVPLLPVAFALEDGGVLEGAARVEWLNAADLPGVAAAEQMVLVTDGGGRVVAALGDDARKAARAVEKTGPPPDSGTWRMEFGGRRRLLAAGPLQNGLRIIVGVDLRRTLAPARWELLTGFGTTLLVLVLAAVLGRLVALRLVLDPMREVLGVVDEYARGNYDARATTSVHEERPASELEKLAVAVDELGARLADREAELVAAYETLAERERRFKELSRTDALTGLYNSREFSKRFKAECKRSIRHGSELSLILMDVDDFKSYNDTYGHLEGDVVLNELGRFLGEVLRESDIAFRYGGEEFTVLLPETGLDGAVQVAERIRRGFAELVFYPEPDVCRQCTLSLGVARCRPEECAEDCLKRADTRMYAAKRKGKDRVEARAGKRT